MQTVRATFLFALLAAPCCASADVDVTEATNISVDAASDGRIAIDLLGELWVVPRDGGKASAIESGLRPAHRPRWSPAADTLVYQASSTEREELWVYDRESARSERLDNGRFFNQHPDWHPDGERVTFSSDRNDSGFDIWEIDVATRLTWRLSNLPGNETEPSWSADGRNLLFIHEHEDRWSLMLRRHGEPDVELIASGQRIAAPSWRPDGSLVTYMQSTSDGWTVRMAILSDPILDRPIIENEDFFITPITWLDRQQMLYAANGKIRKRRFNSWTSVNVPFRATIGVDTNEPGSQPLPHELPDIEVPGGTTVIRAGRYYDGINNRYESAADIVIENGRIAAVESHQDRDGVIVINLGDVTILPGFIDAHAHLPANIDASLGPLILGLGVTTIVAEHDRVEELNALWAGKAIPGPRVLSTAAISNIESWQIGFGTEPMPTSPEGRSYQDVQLASGADAVTFVSGLADSHTPNLKGILDARLARQISRTVNVTRRFASPPDVSAAGTSVVLGSAPNKLPPGIAQHAELRALHAAGLSPEQALKAAGVNAAAALGLGLQVGRIAPGARADLLLVDGDPLSNIDDAIKILGVVRNGRFFSVSGLVDRAEWAKTVKPVE